MGHPDKALLQKISDFQALAPLVDAFAGTCLEEAFFDPEESPGDLLATNDKTFTQGGSWPRDVWVESGRGATFQGSLIDSGQRTRLIDLCTILTVLGSNDPWVKLKQVCYLLTPKPHHVTIRMGSDIYYRVAQRLLRCFEAQGGDEEFVVNIRQCNGSDAVELALHQAWKRVEGQTRGNCVATFGGSYHGESLTASLISDHDRAHGSGRLLVASLPNVLRMPSPEADDDGNLTARTVETLKYLDEHAEEFVAVIIEPIQWRRAVHAVPQKFLRALREVCLRRDVCLIFDEIHNGFGYMGAVSFAQSNGICPDISILSKGLTAGHGSLAVTVARKPYAAVEGPFSGKSNASEVLSLIAVDAVLDRLLGVQPFEKDHLPSWLPEQLKAELQTGLLPTRYDEVVEYTDTLLAELQERFPTRVGRATGAGLVRGLVLLDQDGVPSADFAKAVTQACLVNGVYVRQADTALFVKPPLTISAEEMREATDALTRTLEAVMGRQ